MLFLYLIDKNGIESKKEYELKYGLRLCYCYKLYKNPILLIFYRIVT